METQIGRIIGKYGTAMEVYRDGQWEPVRAFWQPVDSRGLQNIRKEVSPLGEIPGGQYLFIGPVGAATEGDSLRLGEQIYEIRQLDTHYYGDTAVYCWGLCTGKGTESA